MLLPGNARRIGAFLGIDLLHGDQPTDVVVTRLHHVRSRWAVV